MASDAKGKGKTIVVTGGAGFIGSHLCEKLLANGNKVVCVDNFITGNKKNIQHLLSGKNVEYIEHDITTPLKISGFDELYNLASPASPFDYYKKPIETLHAGSFGVKNMLDLCKANNATFLQASTSEVYGDPKEHPQKETYFGNVNPVGPRACYDESKRFAEALIVNYAQQYKLDTRIARIFNTYGPRMRKDDGRVIPNFISQALKGKPLTIYGKGQQTRSFCYVDDEVEGIYKLLMSDITDPVNIGNPDEMTVMEFAELIIRLTKSKSTIIHKPLPEDDPKIRQPDITLAKKKLGWEPSTSIEEGLRSTIAYFRELE